MPSPRGDAVPVEFSINELTSTTAALGKAMLVFDKVNEIVDAQPDQGRRRLRTALRGRETPPRRGYGVSQTDGEAARVGWVGRRPS